MIRLTQVRKSYGRRAALRSITFALHRGEVLGLLGHNGAGKTTTLRLMTGLLEPTAGAIEVLDQDLPTTPQSLRFKQRLGYVPDEPFLYPYLTGREMLQFIGTLYRLTPRWIEASIQKYGTLLELDDAFEQLTSAYSRGMRRKLALAGSLLHQPLYWLLDEPTEALDPMAVRALKQLIREFRHEGRAVLISTHQLALAQELCDRLVVLHEGSVVFDGSLADLRRRCELELSSLEELYFTAFGLRRAEIGERRP